MSDLVRAGLIQQRWTGDKESMIANAVDAIGKAASQGAQVVCLQELFYGPYFCQIQDADFASETANMSSANILQQAGVSVLAQANSSTQSVLKLLQ